MSTVIIQPRKPSAPTREELERRMCAACQGRRLHTAREWGTWHPLAGHGFTREGGWTHTELEREHKEKTERPEALATNAKTAQSAGSDAPNAASTPGSLSDGPKSSGPPPGSVVRHQGRRL